MDAEEQHEAQDHHQQSHDVLPNRAGFSGPAYHLRRSHRNAAKSACRHAGSARSTAPGNADV
jgi:hypothetical protein